MIVGLSANWINANQTANKLNTEGEKLYSQKKYKEARHKFEEILKKLVIGGTITNIKLKHYIYTNIFEEGVIGNRMYSPFYGLNDNKYIQILDVIDSEGDLWARFEKLEKDKWLYCYDGYVFYLKKIK